MGVDRIGAVIALGAERPIEQGVDRERIRLPRLVGHLAGGLIDVDQGAVEVREAHRHARAGEEAGAIQYPTRRPEVIVGIEPDAVVELHLRTRRPIRPGDAVVALGRGRRGAWPLARERGELLGVIGIQLGFREVGTAGVDMESDLEPLGLVGRGLGVRQRRSWNTCRRCRARTPSPRPSTPVGWRPGTGQSAPRCRCSHGRHRS